MELDLLDAFIFLLLKEYKVVIYSTVYISIVLTFKDAIIISFRSSAFLPCTFSRSQVCKPSLPSVAGFSLCWLLFLSPGRGMARGICFWPARNSEAPLPFRFYSGSLPPPLLFDYFCITPQNCLQFPCWLLTLGVCFCGGRQ